MQIREEKVTTFSKQLKQTYNWFYENFVGVVNDSLNEFWGCPISAKLISVCENKNVLSSNEEFFVTQIRLNKELSVFIRLSKKLVKSLLEKNLGSNGRRFDIEKISELEAKILTGFNDFLYQNFNNLIKNPDELPLNNTNYNECNLIFFLKDEEEMLGKIVIKIPVVAISPGQLENASGYFDITDFAANTAEVNISVGTTKIKLNDVKNLEYDDIVLLENSNIQKMVLKYKGYSCDVNISPNPAIILDDENNGFDENGGEPMTGPDLYNMWDSIQVEIGAEFEKVKLTLGELKQISEGLVVDIGSVYDNKIDLKVEDKIVASGELVIINDRYGVRISQIFTEDKQEESYSENDEENFDEEVQEEKFDSEIEEENFDEDSDQYEMSNEEFNEEENEENYDYSNFDVDEEDI